MRNIIYSAVLIIFFSYGSTVFARNGDYNWYKYFPLSPDSEWIFEAYKKKEPEKKFKIKASMEKIAGENNKEIYVFSAPEVDVEYGATKGNEGMYLTYMRYPFEVLGLNFSIYVALEPDMLILKFPFKSGNEWNYAGRATAHIFGFIRISRKVKVTFREVAVEEVILAPGKIQALHCKSFVDEGVGEKISEEDHWYGENIGCIISDTKRHFFKLEDFKQK